MLDDTVFALLSLIVEVIVGLVVVRLHFSWEWRCAWILTGLLVTGRSEPSEGGDRERARRCGVVVGVACLTDHRESGSNALPVVLLLTYGAERATLCIM